MENVVAYLKDHWQYVVIAGGGLTLLGGAIFNWRWVHKPDGERPKRPRTLYLWTYSDRAGIVSLWAFWAFVIIACGIFLSFVGR